MANPFSVQCPNCDARLKIQNPKAVGKKVRCPNCQNPFTVQPPRTSPPVEDFGFDEEYDDYEDGYDEYEDDYAPRRSAPRRGSASPPKRKSPRSGGKASRRKSRNQIPLIAGGVALGLLLLVGLGFAIYSFAGGGGQSVEFDWLPPDSAMVVSVDVDEVWDSGFARRIRNLNEKGVKEALDEMTESLKEVGFAEGESIDAIDRFTAGFTDSRHRKGLAVIVKKSPWNIEAIKEKNNLDEAEHDGKTYYRGLNEAHYFPDPETMVVGDRDAVEEAMERGPKSNLAEKFSFLPKGDVVVGAIDHLEEFTKGPGPGISAEKLKAIAVTFNLGSGIDIDVLALCQDSAGAEELDRSIKDGLAESKKAFKQGRDKNEGIINQMPNVKELVDEGERILNSVSSSRSGDQVTVSVEIPGSVFDKLEQLYKDMKGGKAGKGFKGFDFREMLGGFGPGRRQGGGDINQFASNPIGQAREAQLRSEDKNNLKKIGIALHNYHRAYRSFPLAAGQTSKLSWRVQILPFLGEKLLYDKFRHDESWNSAQNMQLMNQMPQVFRRPGSMLAPGKTSYLAIAGRGGIMENGGGKGMADVIDGTTNTIMVAEVEDYAAVFWTQPIDYNYNAGHPIGQLGGWRDGFHALFCDGSVRYIAKAVDPQTLVRLFQINDRQPVGDF